MQKPDGQTWKSVTAAHGEGFTKKTCVMLFDCDFFGSSTTILSVTIQWRTIKRDGSFGAFFSVYQQWYYKNTLSSHTTIACDIRPDKLHRHQGQASFWNGLSVKTARLKILQQQTLKNTKTFTNLWLLYCNQTTHNSPRARLTQFICPDSKQSLLNFQMARYRSSSAPNAKPKNISDMS